jgi:hypothetical protein
MESKPFDQGQHLGALDRGVCIQLVMIWLGQGGRELKRVDGLVKQAKGIQQDRSPTPNKLLEQFLTLVDIEDFASPAQVGDALTYLLNPGYYIIGFFDNHFVDPIDGTIGRGHAIGAIAPGAGAKHPALFDSNEGYKWMDHDAEYRRYLSAAMATYQDDFDEIILTKCTPVLGGVGNYGQVVGANINPMPQPRANLVPQVRANPLPQPRVAIQIGTQRR